MKLAMNVATQFWLNRSYWWISRKGANASWQLATRGAGKMPALPAKRPAWNGTTPVCFIDQSLCQVYSGKSLSIMSTSLSPVAGTVVTAF